MRISDWSSYVGASDLPAGPTAPDTAASAGSWRASVGGQDAMHVVAGVVQLARGIVQVVHRRLHHHRQQQAQTQQQHARAAPGDARMREMPAEIGKASGWGRGGEFV